ISVKSHPTQPDKLAHPFDTQTTLQRHYVPDVVVDARSPIPLLSRCRASIFCKAPLKKSTSSVFSANNRFKSLISLRSLDSRDFSVGWSSPTSAPYLSSCHLYKVCRGTPSSFASHSMFSQFLNRSTAARRKSSGYRHPRPFAICREPPFPCKV